MSAITIIQELIKPLLPGLMGMQLVEVTPSGKNNCVHGGSSGPMYRRRDTSWRRAYGLCGYPWGYRYVYQS
jgi:hypothetical protein